MRPYFTLLLAAVSPFAHAGPVVNPNGSVMTPNSELAMDQPVATDVSGLLSYESDPHVSFTNGELWVHGNLVDVGPDEAEVSDIANRAILTNAATANLTERLDGKVSKDGGIITGSLIIGNSSIEDAESLSAENSIRANGGFSRFSYSWHNNPKLKWMGEYFEDSISGDNGRIYIPYTDAPWIDAIKEGSVKGLALYSDLDGFIKSEADPVFTAWRDNSFSNAVLAVGLNIDTNAVAVLNEIADGFGGFPIEGTATTVGGLLAALAAAVAWLKKNKVQTLKLEDESIVKTAENGFAKLDDFFTDSNSLLTGTIDDRLPIPISAKSAGFTTESYKRFIVTVSGDMTVTLHTPTSGDAEIFECRFNGTGLDADASITFAGAAAITMDANCGTVTAGKVALMSAFWNGTTWDVNWKVEG